MIRICAKSSSVTVNEHMHLERVLYTQVKGFNQCSKLHPATTFMTALIMTMFASLTLAESTTSTCCQLWNLRRQKKRSSLVQLLFHVTLSGSPKKHCLNVRKSLELSHSKHGLLSIPGVRCSFLATCEHQWQLSTSDSSRFTNTNSILSKWHFLLSSLISIRWKPVISV